MQVIMPLVRVRGSHTVHGSEALASPSGDQSESSEILIPTPPAPTHDNTTAVAMVGMQGTFNWIADVFTQLISIPDDQTAERTSTAIQNVLTVDDGLTAEEKATVVSIFAQKASIANVYLALTDDKVRRIFLHQIMDDKAA